MKVGRNPYVVVRFEKDDHNLDETDLIVVSHSLQFAVRE